MKTYKIKIKEVLSREIEIKADSQDEALSMVEEMYDNEEIVLDSSDFEGSYVSFVPNLRRG